MVTISRDSASKLTRMLDDVVEYWVKETIHREGTLVSGETAWKIINSYSLAKEAQIDIESN